MIEVGKKIVCIEQDPCNILVEGEIYSVYNKTDSFCQCGIQILDIGIKIPWMSNPKLKWNCLHCGKTCNQTGDNSIWWFKETYFRLMDYDYADNILSELFPKNKFYENIPNKTLKQLERYL